jgi:beta-lactamase regulating signal transducer with metallopeptidase domain
MSGIAGAWMAVAWKAAVLLALAAAVTRLMTRRTAAERHAVWLVAVACVLALPLVTVATPSWTVRVPVRASVPAAGDAVSPPAEWSAESSGEPAPASPAQRATSAMDERMPATVAMPAPAAPSRSLLLLLLAWALGALWVAGSVVVSVVRVHMLAARAVSLRDGALLARARGIGAAMGVTRPVRVLEGDADAMPLTFGVVRPTLLLPSSAGSWSASRQEAVLRHELTHIRRHDSLTQLLAGMACVLHWYNPLAWLAARRMSVEREHACDDAVLAAGLRATDYAAELLDIARGMRVQRSTALAAIAMARPSSLRTRLAALLEDRPRRERASTRLLVPVWIGAALLLTPLSSISPVLAERDAAPAKKAKPAKEWKADVAPVLPDEAALHAGLMAPGTPQAQESCLTGRNSSVNTNSNDERHTVKWNGNGCSGELVVERAVRFDADFTRIASIEQGGKLVLQATDGDVSRRVVMTPAGNGLSHEYSVNGSNRPFDAEAERWVEARLLFLFRYTGWMAEERALAMLERRGVQAVFDELSHMRSDYTRSVYLGALLESGRLDEASLRRVLDIAGSIDSDHYRAQLLTGLNHHGALAPAVRSAYLEAAAGIDSDHYKADALASLLEHNSLDDAATQRDFVHAASGIDSDHYLHTLLMGLVKRDRLDDGALHTVLGTAEGIDSDHYRSTLLTEIVKRHALEGELHEHFVKLMEDIDSDTYRGRVKAALQRRSR